ncbi:MAG: glycoside hydrolase family 9 protein [Ruminococcus flavefaciens]|nr:glycoside hydrolase family 9 protein [Ruminococcus flavefaciens]MCM1229153.1 glycoside hydrolase family 9 protein [Ruminococcus flavefaciens]
MKDFRSVIDDYLKKHDRHKKQLAAVVSLSMLVSFTVPMVLQEPASGMTGDSFTPVGDILSTKLFNLSQGDMENVAKKDGAHSSQYASAVELLIGTGRDWTEGCTTPQQVSEAARKEFFLGIASDFCVFLENGFSPKAADAEGRVAALYVDADTTNNSNWDYQIGKGDYGNTVKLEATDKYNGITGFAAAIVGTENSTDEKNGFIKNIATQDEGDYYRQFVVAGDVTTFTHHKASVNGKYSHSPSNVNYGNCSGCPDELTQFYQGTLIDLDSEFSFIKSQSSKLSKISQTQGAYVDWNDETRVVTFFVPEDCNDETVYFNIPEEVWKDPTVPSSEQAYTFNFVNIPKFEDEPKVTHEWKDDNGNKREYTKIANIVINVGGKSIDLGKKGNKVKTVINDIEVSNQGWEATNNHPYSENLLYNFYEAQNVYISANFNGTILAPNANVTSADNCEGHLSGSLIAQSFTGGLEFGYRPYRGTVDILGSSNGYAVPFDKFITGTNTHLEGATFGIYEGENEIDSFTIGNGTEYVNLPSKVDFESSEENASFKTVYTVKEKSAPTGFIKDDDTYYTIEIAEQVKAGTFNDPVEGSNGSILSGRPSEVAATVTISGNNGYTTQSFNIYLKDIWGYDESSGNDAIVRREIYINKDTDSEEVFYLDMDNGNVTAVSKKEGNSIGTGVVAQTGPRYTAKITTEYSKAIADTVVVTEVVTDADNNPVTDNDGVTQTQPVTTDDGVTQTEIATTVIKKAIGGENLPEYTLNVVRYAGDVSGGYTVVLYYNDPNKTYTYSGNSKNDSNDLDLGENVDKNGVVGVSLTFNNDTNQAEFYIQENSSSWSPIFKTYYGNQMSFKSGETYYYFTENKENPANTTTRIETSYSTVTTSILTEDLNYETETFDINTSTYAMYGTILADVSAQTYGTYTTVADDGSEKKTPKYRFDPDAMMMMPLPVSVPSFYNDYGLIFQKVSKSGETEELLPNAVIQLEKVTFNGDEPDGTLVEGMSDVLAGGSSNTIDLGKITPGELYRFVETGVPANHEKADPIYFVYQNKTVYWTDDVAKAKNYSNTADWAVVNLTINNTSNPDAVTMIDIKKSGATLQLQKTNEDFTEQLAGSKFKLYVKNGQNTTLIYPTDDTSFEIPEEGINLYDVFKANPSLCNSDYIKDGYLVPGLYKLDETKAPDDYDQYTQGFEFRVKNDYSIEPVAVGSSAMGDEGDMFLGTADGNPVLTIKGKMLDIIKANPDEVFITDLVHVNQIHVSSDGSGWGGNLNITNKSSYTFNEILSASGKSADEIQYIRFMHWEGNPKTPYDDARSPYYDGAPSGASGGGSGSSGNSSLVNGMNGNNGTVTVSGALLAAAKANPDTEFIELSASGGGQIHILTNSITNIDQGQIAGEVSKKRYTFNDILNLAKSAGKANSADEITTVRFMEWTNGGALTGTALIDEASTASVASLTAVEAAATEAKLSTRVLRLADLKSKTKSAGTVSSQSLSLTPQNVSVLAGEAHTINQFEFNGVSDTNIKITLYYANGDTETVNLHANLYQGYLGHQKDYYNVVGIAIQLDNSNGTVKIKGDNYNHIFGSSESGISLTSGQTSTDGSSDGGTTDPEPTPTPDPETVTLGTEWDSSNNTNKFLHLTKNGQRLSSDKKIENVKDIKLTFKTYNKPENVKLYGNNIGVDPINSNDFQGSNNNWTYTYSLGGNSLEYLQVQQWDGNLKYLDSITITLNDGSNTTYTYHNDSVETENAPTATTTQSTAKPTTPTTTTTVAVDGLQAQTSTKANGDVVLQLPNRQAGEEMSVEVEKEWKFCDSFPELKNEVTVTLERYTDAECTEDSKDGSFSVADIKLNADNSWKGKWDNLPRSEGDTTYYYKVVEASVPDNFTATYSTTDGIISSTGKVTITNTPDNININAKKEWIATDESLIPESVEVQLQYSKDNGSSWESVEGATYVLDSENEWTTEIEHLPSVYKYRIIETDVPAGWTSTDGNEVDKNSSDKTSTVTNTQQTGSLGIQKIWENDTANDRPDSITVNLYRSTQSPVSGSSTITPQAYDNYSNYAKALQYSLYFYDANMCGDDVGETSAYSWRNDCHLGGTVNGGYHDAGDHTMFGLNQGFSSSALGWNYYEFKEAFDSLGQTEHYKTIMKYFCDFYTECIKTENGTTKVLVQRGEPGKDQAMWQAPEGKTCDDYGGEEWVTSGSANIAAQYAATLAQYAINFPDDSDSKTYLAKAKELYKYADDNASNSAHSYNGNPDDENQSELAWASAWMYLATKENSYKTKCSGYLSGLSIHKWFYYYSDVAAAAMLVYGAHIDPTYDLSALKAKLNETCTGDSYKVLDSWGSARHNTLLQTVALSATKNFDDCDYTDWCEKQMRYILGENDYNNNKGVCLVVGYNSDISATSPHHRAASGLSGYDGENGYNKWKDVDKAYTQINGSHTILGALCGGPGNSSFTSYNDKIGDTSSNEVTIDYNAGLVGAAAGLYQLTGKGETDSAEQLKTASKDSKFTPYTETPINVAKSKEVSTDDTQIQFNIGDNNKLVLTDSNGNEISGAVWSATANDVFDLNDGVITAKMDGTATIKATANGTTYTFQVKVALSSINEQDYIKKIESYDPVQSIEITSNDTNWTKNVSNLPLYNKDGQPYYYYIVEADISTTSYYPISYSEGITLVGNTSDGKLTVTNKKPTSTGVTLPEAGGRGTRNFYLAGACLIGLAGIFLIDKRRKTTK